MTGNYDDVFGNADDLEPVESMDSAALVDNFSNLDLGSLLTVNF